MEIARIIRSSRRRAGMSQRQLAAAAQVPQATVGRIEAGSVSPRADTVARLLEATGTSWPRSPDWGSGLIERLSEIGSG